MHYHKGVPFMEVEDERTDGGRPAGEVITETLKCGETATYTNTSGMKEYITLNITNRCKYTAYLWILFPNGRFIQESIPPGGSYNNPTWLPDKGSIEFNCTLVETVSGEGCPFSYQIIRRQ